MVFTQVGSALMKRAVDNGQQLELPAWSWLVFLLDLIVLLPIIVVVSPPASAAAVSLRPSMLPWPSYVANSMLTRVLHS